MSKAESHIPLNREQLRKDVHAALRAWHTIGGTPKNLLSSLLLVQERRRRVAADGSPATLRLATNQILLEAIEELEKYEEFRANVLRGRFSDQNTILSVAYTYNVSPDHVNREQREAISQITDILLAWESSLREERARTIEASLPPPMYDRLFGFGEVQELLLNQLLKRDTPWVIALTGPGGMGKTTLADAITRRAIQHFHFDQIIWVRAPAEGAAQLSPQITFESILDALAKQLWSDAVESQLLNNRLVAVRRELKERQLLVVIDNLENESDAVYLLSQLANLAGPSKFLLTSRARLPSEAGLYSFAVNELEYEDAISLLLHHANATGATSPDDFTEEEGRRIYQVTGGNPLAIKLAAGLTEIVPLPDVVRGFTLPSFRPMNELYENLYGAVWQTTSENARTLLITLLTVAEAGALPSQLQAASGLSEAPFWSAVAELASRCLLEIRGTNWEKRYGIHRLTESFLRTKAASEMEEQYRASVCATLNYWHNMTCGLDDARVGELGRERAHMRRAVELALAFPEMQQSGANFLLQVFPLVERFGEWASWIPLFEQVSEGDGIDDAPLRSRLANRLGILHRLQRNLEEAVAAHETAIALAQAAGDDSLISEAQFHLSETYRHMRRYAEATEAGEAALEHFKRSKAETRWVAAALNTLGLVARAQGELAQAEEQLSEAVALWRSNGGAVELARSLNNLGHVLRDRGNYAEALGCYQEASTPLQDSAFSLDRAMLQISIGTLYFQMERMAEAEKVFSEVDIGFLQQVGHHYYQALVVQNLGIVQLEQRKLAEAEIHLQRSVSLWKQVQDDVMLGNTLGALAELKALLGKDKEALRLYDEAIALLEQPRDSAFARRVLSGFKTEREELRRNR